MNALPDAIRGYARRLHTVIGDDHHIASPLGAWLVLALAAPAADGPEAARLAEVLGMPVDDAATAARTLLDAPHPAVAAAAAAWTGGTGGQAADWLAGLPDAVERGPIPSQDEADGWARRNTYGLIDRFPGEIDESLIVLLASALATRITWLRPFDTTPSREFRSGWRDRVTTVLCTPDQGHHCALVRHDRAGDLAVHRAGADGLVVTSVIAGPGVAAADVLAAAHDVAGEDTLESHSLFDLPLGDGPSWTLTETDGVARTETLTALLPAWSARSEHELRAPDLGFADAARALMRLFGEGPWDASQSAVARYHRRGFEAAAVTALYVASSLRLESPGRQRHALLRFDRPYAVVASIPHGPPSPWIGLPVFSAWVTEPDEATD